jgi:hypothetical protein
METIQRGIQRVMAMEVALSDAPTIQKGDQGSLVGFDEALGHSLPEQNPAA